jgi:hypothetical protein
MVSCFSQAQCEFQRVQHYTNAITSEWFFKNVIRGDSSVRPVEPAIAAVEGNCQTGCRKMEE